MTGVEFRFRVPVVAGRLALVGALALAMEGSAAAAQFVVTSTSASGAGSLKQAILDANATDGTDTITFNIAGTGLKTITGALPVITDGLLIDGYSQPGAAQNTEVSGGTNATLRIEVSGTGLGIGASVLRASASEVTFRGLLVTNIPTKGTGIRFDAGTTDGGVQGCFVGTTIKGLTASSSGTGILVAGEAAIGSSGAGFRNLISGNPLGGISVTGTAVLRNNLIGTTSGGDPTLGNQFGVRFVGAAAAGSVVGGTLLDGNGNVIAGNDDEGIVFASSAGTGNVVTGNLVFGNGGPGIDLGEDGRTFNDEDDDDSGPNGRQNWPELSAARVNGTVVTWDGVLRSRPGTYVIQVFRSSALDPEGQGQAEAFVAEEIVEIPDGEEAVAFRDTFNLAAAPGASFFLTATATAQGDEGDGTSEFSNTVEAVLAGSVLTVTTSAASGPGSLAAALATANGNDDANTIVFAIPGNGPHEIQPTAFLAIDGAPVFLDGYSQPGSRPNTAFRGTNADLRVAINGSNYNVAVLDILRTEAHVRGVALHSGIGHGIRLVETTGVQVEGCFIGTDVSGTEAAGNSQAAISNSGSVATTIGGPALGNRNLVSGGKNIGIADRGSGTVIVNNLVGTAADGVSALGNGGSDALNMRGSSSVVGGDDPGLANVVRSNSGAGITVGDEGSGVTIMGNHIFANGGRGIDLAAATTFADGLTPNDIDDADTGGNALQNFPVLFDVVPGSGVAKFSGSLDVPAGRIGSLYRLRFFRSRACDSSGHGEGEEFLNGQTVSIPSDEEFSFSIPAVVSPGDFVTATATDLDTGATSEFSACFEVPEVAVVCGDASGNEAVQAGDALLVLQAAVGITPCEACVCDVNGINGITSADALAILRKAVGQAVLFDCPDCG